MTDTSPEGRSEEWRGTVADVAQPAQVVATRERFGGHVWSVRTDTIRLRLPGVDQPPKDSGAGEPTGSREDGRGDGGVVVERDVVVHPGAVGVAAVDERGCILLLRQYRHPVGGYLFELPAGLRDIAGEPPLDTARRELAEEAGLTAQRWDVLVDFYNSPGGSTEAFRCFLARDLDELPGGRPRTGEAEEADLPRVWIPLEEAVDLVLAGALHNPTTVAGVLAASAASRRGWTSLRNAEGPMWSLPTP